MSGRSRTRIFRSSSSAGSHTVCRSRRNWPHPRRCRHKRHRRMLRTRRCKPRPRILDRPCRPRRNHCHSDRHRSWYRRIRRRNTRGCRHKRMSRRPLRLLPPRGCRRPSWSPQASRPPRHPYRPSPNPCPRPSSSLIPQPHPSARHSCRSHRSHSRNRCSPLLERRGPAARGSCTTPPKPTPNRRPRPKRAAPLAPSSPFVQPRPAGNTAGRTAQNALHNAGWAAP